jgi:2-hydroxy-4-carboxymuconate semialdehyde hemiacetal dehydrogenase
MKLCLAGEGAIAHKHLAALSRVDDVEVVSLAGGVAERTGQVAREHGIAHWSLDLEECLDQPEVEAAILATPTPLHASQAESVLRAGKHVLVEIPMAESLKESESLEELGKSTGRVGMVCHTRRFNPSHRFIHERIRRGELALQHLVVETFFFRRENKNALGEPRSWTDHLLWHHACHSVDLFRYQTQAEIAGAWAQEGPAHPELGIAMDMTIGLKSEMGAICSLALSFNNDGPLGTFFRYICDDGTYIARYDELVDGKGDAVDLSPMGSVTDGIEVQDREFIAAIREGREPQASFRRCVPTMAILDRLAACL